jgi:hypothetical protein
MPTWSHLAGFEVGLGEVGGVNGAISVQSSIKRSGSYALRVNPAGTGAFCYLQQRAAGGTLASIYQSAAVWIYVVSAPLKVSGIGARVFGILGRTVNLFFAPGGFKVQSYIDSSNTYDGTTVLSLNQWHQLAFDVKATGTDLYVNGVLEATESISSTAGPSDQLLLGVGASGFGCDYYLDDIAAASDPLTGGLPSNSRSLVLLVPTGDASIGTGWTAGAGGASNLFEAVNNIPPVGLADGSATDTSQIRNASTGSNLDYQATCQSYSAAGVPANARINAVMALCNDGEGVSTGTKAGGVWIVSNPAQSAPGNTLDYGNDGGACGTSPTGWTTNMGPAANAPSVTLGTAPVAAIRKTGSTNRAVDVDFLGIYVDYAPSPIGKSRIYGQAINRSSRF